LDHDPLTLVVDNRLNIRIHPETCAGSTDGHVNLNDCRQGQGQGRRRPRAGHARLGKPPRPFVRHVL